MPKYQRIINLTELLKSRSYFLYGPRQTGKSWLIHEQLPNTTIIDLLESDTYLEFQRHPNRLRELVFNESGICVIDEIQRIPTLLDEVHSLIERRNLRFLLTGSSARKIKSQGINLLGGRARSCSLHPLVSSELKEDFNLSKALSSGTIPSIYLSQDPWLDLRAYADNYITLEIANESLTRNLSAFSRFLEVAALCNTQIINYTKIGNDAQVPSSTVQEYFQILRDTLIGTDLPVWQESKQRKASRTAKFYFFDCGVVRALQGRKELLESSAHFGEIFETYIYHELASYTDYNNLLPLAYWRTQNGEEVDFILNMDLHSK